MGVEVAAEPVDVLAGLPADRTGSTGSTGTADRVDRVDRVDRARTALRRAEERTGARTWVRPASVLPAPAPAASAVPVVREAAVHPPLPAPGQAVPRRWGAPSSGQVVHALPHPGAPREVATGERVLPVPPGLVGLLPDGGLGRGRTVSVQGSTALLLALLAEASRGGAWVAFVGMPEVGLLAAHQTGLVLDRVVLVPAPGPDAPAVLGAVLDGMDVVVVGPAAALTHGDRRRLSARARERAALLVTTDAWPGAHLVLAAHGLSWTGPGRGDGRLRRCRATVRRSGRGEAARPVDLHVDLPVGDAGAGAGGGTGAVTGGGGPEGRAGGALAVVRERAG